MTSERLLTRDFLLNWGASFSAFLAFYLVQQPVMPLYVRSLGGGPPEIGLVIGAASLAMIVMRPVAGRATDGFGRRVLVIAGMAIMALCIPGYVVALTLPMLLALRVVSGVGLATWDVASTTYMSDLAPPARRAEAVGYYGIGNNLALGLGPLIGALLISNGASFGVIFWVATAVAVAAAGVMLPTHESAHERSPRGRGGIAAYIDRRALLPAGVLVSVTLAYGALASFIAPFGLEIGLGRGAAAWFWGVYAVVLISVRLVSGRLADRYGYLASIGLGLLLTAVSLCFVTAAHGLVFFVAGAATFAVGFAFVYPALFAVTIRRVGSENRGTGVGTFTVGFDVGIGLGAIIFGLVADVVGYRTMFLVAGLAPLTGFALVFLRLRRTRREGRAPVMPTPEERERALATAGTPAPARPSETDELVHDDREA